MLGTILIIPLLAAAAPTTTSTTSDLFRSRPPPSPDEPLVRPQPTPSRRRPKSMRPGALLPKVGDGLAVLLNARLGVGDDATEPIRGDPPYGVVFDFYSTVEQGRWFAGVGWGFMIAGPEANRPESGSRQSFQPWEIAFDVGARYRYGPRWRFRPRVGVRLQPDPIGPSTGTDIGIQLDVGAERLLWKRKRNRVTASVRAFGRYGVADHDRGSGQRLRRSSCFVWGEGFVDCTLAFTLAPGTVGAQGRIEGRYEQFGLSLWGGWFVAGNAFEANLPAPNMPAVLQDSGDWAWLGTALSYSPADDVTVAATMLTGGRLRDSIDRTRVPLFTADLARTTFGVRLSIAL